VLYRSFICVCMLCWHLAADSASYIIIIIISISIISISIISVQSVLYLCLYAVLTLGCWLNKLDYYYYYYYYYC